jgi:DNA-binding NtrC family response regulator
MPKVIQLVSRGVSLIDAVHKIVEPTCLDLQVYHSFSSQFPEDDAAVYLLHLESQGMPDEMQQRVRTLASSNRDSVILVLCDDYRDDDAVAMLRAGATDYLDVSTDLCKLSNVFEMISQGARISGKSMGKTDLPPAKDPFSYVLSPEMIEMMDQVRRVAPQDTTLFLTGETGTGKTQLAKLIHELSPRRGDPFMVVDCGALSADLLESEIFGHQKGAFTGATCDRAGKFAAVGKGTLLLDEINSLAPNLQSKLLRAVDDRVFEPVGSNKTCFLEARIIAAANVPLEQAVRAGKFRQDLYYRLNVVGFFLSPLRERRGLIRPLANKLLAECAQRNHLEITGFTQEAVEFLVDYDWPGNIRELRNTIERAALLASGRHIQKRDLGCLFSASEKAQPELSTTISAPLAQTREEAEVQWIIAALQKHKNNRLRAAADLGISRMSLYNKMHKYGLFSQKRSAAREDLRITA